VKIPKNQTPKEIFQTLKAFTDRKTEYDARKKFNQAHDRGTKA
jgi:hypothetical protein